MSIDGAQVLFLCLDNLLLNEVNISELKPAFKISSVDGGDLLKQLCGFVILLLFRCFARQDEKLLTRRLSGIGVAGGNDTRHRFIFWEAPFKLNIPPHVLEPRRSQVDGEPRYFIVLYFDRQLVNAHRQVVETKATIVWS